MITIRDGKPWAEDGLIASPQACAAEIERLRAGLNAAVRAANLALFVINKRGVMPNDSWAYGFKKDLATATAALGNEQSVDK